MDLQNAGTGYSFGTEPKFKEVSFTSSFLSTYLLPTSTWGLGSPADQVKFIKASGLTSGTGRLCLAFEEPLLALGGDLQEEFPNYSRQGPACQGFSLLITANEKGRMTPPHPRVIVDPRFRSQERSGQGQ